MKFFKDIVKLSNIQIIHNTFNTTQKEAYFLDIISKDLIDATIDQYKYPSPQHIKDYKIENELII